MLNDRINFPSCGKNENRNIIDFSGTKSRNFVASVLSAETFGMDNVCHATIFIQNKLTKVLKKEL